MTTKPKDSLTWDLSPLLKSDTDPFIQKERKILQEQVDRFVQKWECRDDYLKEPAILKEALDEYEHWAANYGLSGQQGYYFGLRIEQDTTNLEVKKGDAQITDLSMKLSNEMQFFMHRLARLDKKLQQKFLSYKPLHAYKHFLQRSFDEAQYLLSEPEEKILTLKSIPAHYNWVRMTAGFLAKEEARVLDEDGGYKILPLAKVADLMTGSAQKKVRDIAAKQFNKIIANHVDVAENELNAILADKKINDQLRGIARPEINRHISDDMGSDVVETLISSIEKSFPVSKRFFQLKAKLMKVKKLSYHERYAPYEKDTTIYTFDEASSIVRKTFARLDLQFEKIFNDYLTMGRIDVYPRKGKRSGAFCAHDLLTQPTYILLNFNGKISDILTLAHESGHGINNELMRTKQNALNFGTTLSTGEVASTFMEDFALQTILSQTADDTRLALMIDKLSEDIGSTMLQATLYRFEQELHREFREKGYLSKDEIGKLYQNHMKSFMGNSIDYYKGTEYWWIRSPHLRSSFYNYQYASGLLISKSLQNSVKEDPKFIEKVKEFLSAGTSDSPANIFMKMGIDIGKPTFWQQGLKEIADLLDEAEALAKKLGKI